MTNLVSLEAWSQQNKTQSPILACNGNSAWAQRYSQELREVVVRYADRLPRNVQRHLGPSELGIPCSRNVVFKMAGISLGTGNSNNMHDPWASIVGTAIHSFMELAFRWDASGEGVNRERWFTERRVTPDPGSPSPHPGTADMYDAKTRSVVDWKAQSEGVRDELRRHGPPEHYFWQMLLYAVGYMHEGYPVDRVVLVSLPRTKSTLDDMYAWEHTITTEDLRGIVDLIKKTELREQLAALVAKGEMHWKEIPATPSEKSCQFCPAFRPDAAFNPNIKGCAGTAMQKAA